MSAVRVSLKLCTYSRSDLLASCVLPACPMELREGEHDYCPCRKREHHQAGRTEVRVLTCTWPKLWNGREVMNPPAFAEAVRKSCYLKLQTDRHLARLEAAKQEEAMAKQNQNGMNAPGKPVATREPDPNREQTITDAEVVASTAVVPSPTPVVPARSPLAEVPALAAARAPAPVAIPTTLAGALALAQQKCQPVKKDARNAHHGYSYASAEAVIAEAKRALADTGLALVPSEQALNRAEGGGFELVRKFLLIHVSGESLVLGCAWPVIEERGRPVDKATAISATASLSYLLRDLLLMPRVRAEEDLAGRKDAAPVSARSAKEQAQAVQQAPASPPQAAQPAAPGKITHEQLARLRDLREQLFEAQKPADRAKAWEAIIGKRGVKSAGELTVAQAEELINSIAATLTTHDVERALSVDGKGG